jgi:hypothetical protein
MGRARLYTGAFSSTAGTMSSIFIFEILTTFRRIVKKANTWNDGVLE